MYVQLPKCTYPTTTVIRRFKKVPNKQLVEGVRLPKAIAIDVYKVIQMHLKLVPMSRT
ncbi:hypothetical protein LAV72_18250 [Lysinibacillus xylanilyticus]|uniref:hypothetical protein n=1 Tax=Lysinibacillus xylanilyticus TaxID=582475 RepID=UPI002B242655|nr:hypothetical protein [Lysinibacillus xylanilyticus]MEB2301549.1 hypothetical protein [Lysinibacillus xylanilyticus]